MTVRKYLGIILLSILTLLLFAVNQSHAANQMVKPSGTGDSTGVDWTNARGWSQVTSTNITRGDSLFLADGNYPGQKQFTEAGSAGAFVNIIKATATNHGSAVGWDDSLGDGQAVFTVTGNYQFALYFGSNCWNFDGQTGTGADTTSTYGFKIDISGITRSAYGIYSTAGYDSLYFRHVEIVMSGEDSDYSMSGIYVVGNVDGNMSKNIQISNCYVHDTESTMFLLSRFTDSIIEHNYLQRRHTTNPASHGEGMSLNGDVPNANNIIRYNIIKDVYGTGGIVVMNGDSDHYQIYGNLIFSTNPDRYIFSNGAIGNASADTQTYMQVYNNTIYNCGGTNSGVYFSNGANNEVYNNLWYKCVKVGVTGATYGYNTFLNCPYIYGFTPGATNIVGTTDPFVNSSSYDFDLAGNDSTQAYVIGQADSLSPYNLDMNGITHKDIGALAYTNPLGPTPPSGATATGINTSYATISFEDNSSDEDGFQVTVNGAVVDTISTNTFTLSPTTARTKYNIQIRGIKGEYVSGATVVEYTAPGYILNNPFMRVRR